MDKTFPDNMVPLGDRNFTFACHRELACYTKCCRNVDMFLFPYDIIRLKNSLSMDSATFLQRHTRLVKGHNPYFPSVMMRLADDAGDQNDGRDIGRHRQELGRDRRLQDRQLLLQRIGEAAEARGGGESVQARAGDDAPDEQRALRLRDERPRVAAAPGDPLEHVV